MHKHALHHAGASSCTKESYSRKVTLAVAPSKSHQQGEPTSQNCCTEGTKKANVREGQLASQLSLCVLRTLHRHSDSQCLLHKGFNVSSDQHGGLYLLLRLGDSICMPQEHNNTVVSSLMLAAMGKRCSPNTA